jgi:hypothetical protein
MSKKSLVPVPEMRNKKRHVPLKKITTCPYAVYSSSLQAPAGDKSEFLPSGGATTVLSESIAQQQRFGATGV